MDRTANERKRKMRAKRRAIGMKSKEIWVFPKDWEAIKEFIEFKNDKHPEFTAVKK